ncbi:MAG: nucleotide exchange factor GrpE [Elusimicrobiota bacterium]|jgi:molecular chaperone GrpE|nr:nucleotide exchange factor GrpE [Elusimicrobiota bacterium]
MTKKKETKKEEPIEEVSEQAASGAKQEDAQHCSCKEESCHCQEGQGQELKSDNYYDQLLRLQADFENFRKRTEREAPLLIKYGKAEVLKKLLPLHDSLIKAKEELEKKDTDAAHIKKGLNMIFEEFDKVFKSEGVEFVSAKGKPYDPMTQEVITTMPCEASEDGLVTQELCQGVKLDGKILRHGQVIVGKKKEETPEAQEK